MKRLSIILLCVTLMFTLSYAQNKDETKNKLKSENLEQQGKELDAQIMELTNRIMTIIKKYDLLKTKGIRVIPYQTSLVLGDDYIELEKHSFVRSFMLASEVVGIKTKKIKIYTNGQNISMIESEIYEKDYDSGDYDQVTIVDPTPTSGGTDDIVFTHISKGRELLKNKKLGEVKNTTAFPVRNEIKRLFLIPHLTHFANSLLYIAEAYYKGLKDSESAMNEFLKKSTKY